MPHAFIVPAMRNQAFFDFRAVIFCSIVLATPVALAQNSDLVPFHAQIVTHDEENSKESLTLRIQLSEDLCKEPVLVGEIFNLIGVRVHRFQIRRESIDRKVRLTLPLPSSRFPDGHYLLTLGAPDSLNHSSRYHSASMIKMTGSSLP